MRPIGVECDRGGYSSVIAGEREDEDLREWKTGGS